MDLKTVSSQDFQASPASESSSPSGLREQCVSASMAPLHYVEDAVDSLPAFSPLWNKRMDMQAGVRHTIMQTDGVWDEETEETSFLKDIDKQKVSAGVMTDSILMACCSSTYLLCGAVAMVALTVAGMVWVVFSPNNCENLAPELLSHTQVFMYGFLCTSVLHLGWYYRCYWDCRMLAEMNLVAQSLLWYECEADRQAPQASRRHGSVAGTAQEPLLG
mmetsp:Transcript_50204/g.98412  ORF Transcript_50204/g.98412 Transcript_50204/m.98412 type:complete len:218 (+) Transcript_50204:283-936(+)